MPQPPQQVWDILGRSVGNGLRLRFALESDFPSVAALVLDPSTLAAVNDTAESARRTIGDLWSEGLSLPDMRHLVAVSEEHGNVGYLRLLYPFMQDHCLWLTFFAVVPTRRGQGFGRRILGLLLAQARTCPLVRSLGMHTMAGNARALRLYASLGFECVKREPWDCADRTSSERLTLVQSVDGPPN